MNNKKIFGQRLKKLREEKGVSARIASELCGTSDTTWWNYESGKSFPPVRILLYIADYYDVSLDYLVGRSEKRR